MSDLRDIHEADQEHAENRAQAEAYARDVAAYYGVLTDAGLPGPLVETMTADFNRRWIDAGDLEVSQVFSFGEGD